MRHYALRACLLSLCLAAPSSLFDRTAHGQEYSRAAVQTVYRQGTPHTDKHGVQRLAYDPAESFFPIADWGTPTEGNPYGHVVDWSVLKNAGYNTAWTHYKPAMQSLNNGWSNDMQVILMGQHSELDLGRVRDNAVLKDHLLGIMWKDEPSAQVALDQQQATYDAFQAYRQVVDGYLPDTPVFVGDAAGFNNGPEHAAWWKTWAMSGDLNAQDNYPIYPWTKSIGLTSPGGISESISRAVYANNQQKPVWAIIQAFESAGPEGETFPWRFPTPTQMRAQVYTAIVHGATGVTYFAWDTYISREPNLIGISPDPLANGYVNPGSGGPFQATATPEQIQKSAALWNAVASVNSELQALTPAILSPTVDSSDLIYALQISNRSAPNDPSKYSNTPIRTLLKQMPDGQYVLLAVNMDDRSMDVEFGFSREFEQFGLMFEDDGGFFDDLGGDEFSYHFGPYATHVFTLSDVALEPIPGDFDGNRTVDGDDLSQWEGDFGVNDESDANGDLVSDGTDFLIWQRNLESGDATSIAVPEPAWGPVSLLAIGAGAGRLVGRGRRFAR